MTTYICTLGPGWKKACDHGLLHTKAKIAIQSIVIYDHLASIMGTHRHVRDTHYIRSILLRHTNKHMHRYIFI